MKFAILLAAAVLLALPGCAYYKVQCEPGAVYTAADLSDHGYQVGGRVEATEYGFRLFTIPISMPQPNDMAATLVRQKQAVGLTDLDVEFSEFNGFDLTPWGWGKLLGFLFQVPKMTVSGRPVYKNTAKP
jgi:hypothetical protein